MKGLKSVVVAVAVASIAIAVAVIMTVQSEARPISDVELQEQTESLPEVEALFSKYPDTNVQFNNDGMTRTIDYAAVIDGNDQYRYLLNLGLVVDQTTGKVREMTLSCTKFDGINDSIYQQISENIEEAITNDTCLRI